MRPSGYVRSIGHLLQLRYPKPITSISEANFRVRNCSPRIPNMPRRQTERLGVLSSAAKNCRPTKSTKEFVKPLPIVIYGSSSVALHAKPILLLEEGAIGPRPAIAPKPTIAIFSISSTCAF
ncbi:MAG: hypothetical protein JW395_0327 [Nitrospira sp.]|nr:hypothetical protein [Nitrospira sp.]